MSKWVMSSTTFDLNPARDTGWVYDIVVAEHHPIGATTSVLQNSGTKSPTRTVEGITKSSTVKAALDAMLRTTVTLVDHRSVSSSVFVAELKWNELNDVTNIGVGTFSYQMKLIKR